MGELAQLYNGEYGLKCDLVVVPCENWKREMFWDRSSMPERMHGSKV